MAPRPTTNTPVTTTVQLPPKAYEFLVAHGGDAPSEKLGKWASYFVTSQAEGGLMVSPTDVQYLRNLNDGKGFATAKDIVVAVEKSLSRVEAQYSYTVSIDPAFIIPMQEHARFAGSTIQEIVEQTINMAMQNGWAHEFTGHAGPLHLTPEDDALFVSLTGKKVYTAHDIAEYFRSQNAEQKAA